MTRPRLARYFTDTEFVDIPETGWSADFVSIGIVAEDAREYYGVLKDASLERYKNLPLSASSLNNIAWLQDNVFDKLPDNDNRQSLEDIRAGVLSVIQPAKTVEFWARNGSYDHYFLCRVFGGMGMMRETLKAEKNIKRVLFRDTNELRVEFQKAALPFRQPEHEKHIAICDARQERKEFFYLKPTDC